MWQKIKNFFLTHSRLEDKREKRKRLLLIIGISFVVLFTVSISAFASYRYFSSDHNQEEIEAPIIDLSQKINLDPSQINENDKKTLAVLLLGYGGPGHEGGYLTDVIQVVYFNFEKKQITFISIPRDLQITLENGESRKINSVMSYGMTGENPVLSGSSLTKSAISQVIGLPIKYFVAVDFVGFKRTIGYGLDGIEVDVAQTFEDSWYPIEGEQLNPCGHSPEEIASLSSQLSGFELEKQFACRYEHLYYKAGLVKMEGDDALKYVRSRHSTSDFDRSRRQSEVLLAIRKKLFSLDALNYLPKYFAALDQYVETDIDLEIAKYLAPLFVDADQFSSNSIILSTENVLTSQRNSAGAFVLLPKMGNNSWQGVKDYIQNNLTE